MRSEGYTIPEVQFQFRENGEFVTRTSSELFNGKRVVIFSLPGAFTPTCSAYRFLDSKRNTTTLLVLASTIFTASLLMMGL